MGSTKKATAKAGKTVAEARLRPSSNQNEVYGPKSPQPLKKAAPPKDWNFSHVPPSATDRAKNGRHQGRNLVTWTRPRMAEKLLLHIQYECSRHKVELPWNAIAHRLNPGSSGGAILQHLNRVRGTLVAEGHLVPPICQKPGSRVVVEPEVRGYVRLFPESDDTISTRPVLFSERMEDRKLNLPDAFQQPDVPTEVKREEMGAGRAKRKRSVKKERPDDNVDDFEDENLEDFNDNLDPAPEVSHNNQRVQGQYRARYADQGSAANANATYQNLDDDEAEYEVDDEQNFVGFHRPIPAHHPDSPGFRVADAHGLGIYHNNPYNAHSSRALAAPPMTSYDNTQAININHQHGYGHHTHAMPQPLPEDVAVGGFQAVNDEDIDPDGNMWVHHRRAPNTVNLEDDHDEFAESKVADGEAIDHDEDDEEEEEEEEEPSDDDVLDGDYQPDSN